MGQYQYLSENVGVLMFHIFSAANMDADLDQNSRKHRDFAQKKFRVIAETFLSQVETSKRSHINLICKVINLNFFSQAY